MEDRTGAGNHPAQTATEAVSADDYTWEKHHATLYRCALASRYHRARERYFDFLDRSVTAASLIGGSAAFAVAADENLVKIAAAAVAMASSLSLVMAFAEKARRHAALAERYKRIEAEIVRVGEFSYTESQVNAWRASIAEIEASEPPALRTLVSLCQNDIAIAEGQPDKVVHQPLWKRIVGLAIDIQPNRPHRRSDDATATAERHVAA